MAESDSPAPGPRLGRRLIVLRVAGTVAAGGAASACVPGMPDALGGLSMPVSLPMGAGGGGSDADPHDMPGTATRAPVRMASLTDADPGDPGGAGRGGAVRAPRGPDVVQQRPNYYPYDEWGGRRRHTGQSDSDPNDAAGYGRPRTGYSDSDSRDAAGRGRPRTGYSDSDPRDGAGRGRPRTGNSDSDPNDPAGRGRPTTGYSDSDPNDPAGRGRRR